MNPVRNIFYALPVKWKFLLRRIYFWPSDLLSRLTGSRNELLPRKGEIFVGKGDFTAQGLHQLELLKKYTNLIPDGAVLDIGCGIGRTAVPLTKMLSEEGSYEGFDVVRQGIDWCNKNISPQYPNFRFRFFPLKNDLYNEYQQEAQEFNFPYSDFEFDTVILFSVFTHMQLVEIENYLREIKRVLKKEGSCLATFFIYDSDQENMIESQSGLRFPFAENGFRLMNKRTKSANVAIEIKKLMDLIHKCDLEIARYIEGYWKENIPEDDHNSFQDILILQHDHHAKP